MRVHGTACGLGVAGSGWVAAPEMVVTNAHVVAGQDDTTVALEGGDELEATAVHYDPRNDLAILAVPGLERPPLDLAESRRKGAEAAVIGYPENGPLTFTAARLGRTGLVTSQDSYGRGPVQRRMTPFRADVRSGNSGGPVVDLDGTWWSRPYSPPRSATGPAMASAFPTGSSPRRWAVGWSPRTRDHVQLERTANRRRTLRRSGDRGHSVVSEPGWRPPHGHRHGSRSRAGKRKAAHVCPDFHAAIELVGRRWAGAILWALAERPRYFAELTASVPGLSDRLLSRRLRELEAAAWSSAASTTAPQPGSPMR